MAKKVVKNTVLNRIFGVFQRIIVKYRVDLRSARRQTAWKVIFLLINEVHLMSVKAVIFDMDGTLTEPMLDFDQIREDMGVSKDAGPILELLEKMSEEDRIIAEKVLCEHENKAAVNSELNNQVLHTLEIIRNASIKMGILTRNTRNNVITVLKKHDLSFDGVFAREDGPAKPDAFGVNSLCEKFGAKPSQTIVVGDFDHDIVSAKEAGAVAVLFKTHKNAEFFAEKADFVIDSFNQVLTIIDNINNQGVS